MSLYYLIGCILINLGIFLSFLLSIGYKGNTERYDNKQTNKKIGKEQTIFKIYDELMNINELDDFEAKINKLENKLIRDNARKISSMSLNLFNDSEDPLKFFFKLNDTDIQKKRDNMFIQYGMGDRYEKYLLFENDDWISYKKTISLIENTDYFKYLIFTDNQKFESDQNGKKYHKGESCYRFLGSRLFNNLIDENHNAFYVKIFEQKEPNDMNQVVFFDLIDNKKFFNSEDESDDKKQAFEPGDYSCLFLDEYLNNLKAEWACMKKEMAKEVIGERRKKFRTNRIKCRKSYR